MVDTAPPQFASTRRWLIRLAWVLLATSVLIPAPAGSFVGDVFGISAFYVIGKAVVWSEAAIDAPGSLGFWPAAILALAVFSSVAFVFAPYLQRCRRVSATWQGFLLIAVAIDASIAFLIPELARLPAYWIWLAAMLLLAIAFVVFPGEGADAGAKPRKLRAATDNGDVPPLFWAMLGFTLFWIAVSAGNHAFPPRDIADAATRAALTSFLTDRASLLTADETARLNAALDRFEKGTSNQIAVAIYPRAPGGSIEAFTIDVADRSRLGRKGIDNGAILFLFMQERTARLEVGYGLEGMLTDADAHRILEANLLPALARGAYFDGLNTTLGAIFVLVEDAYNADRMPGTVTVWWRQVKVALPKAAGNLWPTVRALGLGPRVATTVAGSLIVLILWSVIMQWGRLGGNLMTMARNRRAGRALSTGMETVDLSQIWDSFKLLAWALAVVIPTAGIIVVALGGAFGGAGAMIRW